MDGIARKKKSQDPILIIEEKASTIWLLCGDIYKYYF